MQKDHRDIEGDPSRRKRTSASKVVADGHHNYGRGISRTTFLPFLDEYHNMQALESKSSGDSGEDFDDDFIRRQAEVLRQFENRKLPPKNAPNDASEERHQQHLIDQNIIEEQRRIYEEIQLQRYQARLKSDSRQEPAVVSVKTAASKSSFQYPCIDDAPGARAWTVRNDTSLSTQSEAKTTSDAKRVTEDQVILYDSEKKLHIKGTHHVIHSISNGSAVIVQCPSCQAVLQVDKSCTMLYCVCCHQVSPLDSDSVMMSNVTTAAPMPDALTEHIVRTVQRQEIDVAAARRAAKLARTDGQEKR